MDHRQFFDHHAACWDEGFPPAEIDRIESILVPRFALGAGQSLLDAGCGTGVLIPALLRAIGPSGSVTGLDFSPRMVASARARFGANADFIVADAALIPGPCARFDAVICCNAFPHFTDQPRVLCEFRRVLKIGGRVFIAHSQSRAAINRIHARAGGPVEHDRVPDPPAIFALLEAAGFTDIMVTDAHSFYLACGTKGAAVPGRSGPQGP